MEFSEALQRYNRARERRQICSVLRGFLSQFLAVEGESPDRTMWIPEDHGTSGTVSQDALNEYVEDLTHQIEELEASIAALQAAPIEEETDAVTDE